MSPSTSSGRRLSKGIFTPLGAVAVLAAGQITTFHTIGVMLCEIVLGTSVSAKTRHD
jgi:hypothetical protein